MEPSTLRVTAIHYGSLLVLRSTANIKNPAGVSLKHTFLGNCPHRPTLQKASIITYFSLRAKSWLRGGVGRQFPRNV